MKRKSHRKLIMFISLLIVCTVSIIVISVNMYYYYETPVQVYDSISINTSDGFDIQKLFNQKVNLDNYEIAYLNDDKLEKLDDELNVGVYEIFIKDKKRSVEYESLVTIIDNSGPVVELNEVNTFNSNDYLELATFLKSCTDNVSSKCQYEIYDENENVISSFSHEVGDHLYFLEASDENQNKTITEIKYTIDNSQKVTTRYGVYYSNAGFSSDNPIAAHALTFVGLHGMNCEQFFQMSLFSTPGIKERIKTYSDRQKFMNENRYEVPLIEAMPGDELRYDSNGYGQTHVAIYIGGGMAVHGGFYGVDVVVYDALPANASIPRAYRYNI